MEEGLTPSPSPSPSPTPTPTSITTTAKGLILLVTNCLLLTVGNCGGPLIMRLYYIGGGKRIWLSCWLQTAGWPVIFIPLLINYTRRRTDPPMKLFFVDPRVFLAAAAIGTLTGFDNYLFAYGVSRLPISTSSLITATQLAFTAGFAYLIVKQRFTVSSINAVVLLTAGAAVLGFHANGDRPQGVSNREYFLCFFMTMASSALYGLIMPVVELMYKKVGKQSLTYTLVLEIQLVTCFFATVFCTLGMLMNNDFQEMAREAKEFQLGESKYYLVILCSAIIWQCFFLGVVGVVFYASSLVSAITITVALPVTELLAVIFFKEKFQAEKGISLFLSLCGFISYFYGEVKRGEKKNTD